MSLSIRVLIALAFALWVFPKVVEFMGGPDILDPEKHQREYDQFAQDYADKQQQRSDNLVATLDEFSIQDEGLKRCLSNELRRLSVGTIKHANELTHLMCDRMGIRSVYGLHALENLKVLSLRDNQITRVAPLADVFTLTSVDLTGNPEITDFTALSSAANLSKVRVYNLASTPCYQVQRVMEQIASNGSRSSTRQNSSELLRGIQCSGDR